jgi:hypothetical protein
VRRVLAVNLIACALLFAQYVLGMAVNVFITLPASHPGAAASNYFSGVGSGISWAIASGPAWVAAHTALGLALVVAAIAAVPLARGVSRTATALAVLGGLCIIGAGFNGASFLNYGHAFSSLLMALLWAVALAGYAGGALLAVWRGVAGEAVTRGRHRNDR